MTREQDSWIMICEEKRRDLESIATWASFVGLGRVRDFCRQAKYEIGCEIDRVNSFDQKLGLESK